MEIHVRVVILADLSNGHQRLGVLVWLVGVNVVERRGLGGVTVASGEVDAHCEVDLTTSHDVIEEGVCLGNGLKGLIMKLVNLPLIQVNIAIFVVYTHG